MNMEDLNEAIAELQELKSAAKQKYTQDVLDVALQKATAALQKQKEVPATPKTNDSISEAKPKPTAHIYTIRTYSWDQSDKFMKLYVTVPGLKKTDTNQVKCTFSLNGITLFVDNIVGKTYQLSINNLAKEIVPENSHWKVKDEMVVVFMSKAQAGFKWLAVNSEEAKLKLKKEHETQPPQDADPNQSIMGLMKKMYDEGDDEMKRMINKTYYNSSRNGGMGGDPGKMDFPGMDGI